MCDQWYLYKYPQATRAVSEIYGTVQTPETDEKPPVFAPLNENAFCLCKK